jgi:NAD(P)-dependent dehydrogenase (short-subunit alcohol dehydrogenase family)
MSKNHPTQPPPSPPTPLPLAGEGRAEPPPSPPAPLPKGEGRINHFDLSGKIALVTGASRGLGRHVALTLAQSGADVIVTARSIAALEEPRAKIEALGRRCVPLELEVTDRESIARMAADALAAWGRIDILVNNAGCNVRKPALDITWDDWNRVLDTNLRGPFFVAQAVAPSMIRQGWGRIVNIGSLTAVFGYAGIGPYCASRGGIRQLTMSMADEWGRHGVTVNCLAPGWFKTDQTAVLYENAEWVEYICDRLPLKRPGRIEELEGALLFLASDAASYVTGQTLLVDGGMSTGATRATVRPKSVQ